METDNFDEARLETILAEERLRREEAEAELDDTRRDLQIAQDRASDAEARAAALADAKAQALDALDTTIGDLQAAIRTLEAVA